MFKFLLYTQLVELPVFLALSKQNRTLYAATMMLLINMFSWPIATILFQYTDMSLWTIETIVILLEMLLFMLALNYSWKRAFLFAFIINAISTAVGFLFPGLYAGRL